MISQTSLPVSRGPLAAGPMPRLPAWVPAAGSLGLCWNAFGLTQWAQTTFSSRESLIATGLTPEQADLYAALPAWMTLAFALGAAGGIAGCLLLLMRRRQAVPFLALSLVGYVVLFVGDVTEGVFAAFGAGQVAILSLVVAIAAAFLWLARWGLRRGGLA